MRTTQTSPTAALIEEHRVLLERLQLLEESACAPATSREEIGRRLDVLRPHLADHFRFEEQDGYMKGVLDLAPHRVRQVEQLREEHGELTRLLAALAEEARAADATDDRLREHVRAWIARVRKHEAQENLLVQETFNLEMDAED